jgi:hypothetical protein
MSVIRQTNILGQQRLDVPHLRALESSIAADFDLLAGKVMAGDRPLVVRGFDIGTASAIGNPASTLQLNVAGSAIIHGTASEHGSIFSVPANQAVEVLNSTNTNVSGSFTAGQTNYVGLDLRRGADDSTADLVMFLDANTLVETPKTVPLARILKYKIVITTTDFSSLPYLLPLAKVTTDSVNTVTALEDARPMLLRLGSGGSVPNRVNAFPWASGRQETTSGAVFSGGDKALTSLKDWLDAAMTRLWEIGGGQYWYSPTADRNVTLIWTGSTFTNGENYEWDGTNLHWKGLKFLFDNSAGYYNDVKDQTTDSTGLTNLADGECLYVDLDRSQNLTGGAAIIPLKAAMTTAGVPTVPGSRYILAWRNGTSIFTRGWRYPVGTTFTPATTTSLGVVKLNQTPGSSSLPVVVSIMANGQAEITATASNSHALKGTGHGTGRGLYGIGGSGGGQGIRGEGTLGFEGGYFISTGTGWGLVAIAGTNASGAVRAEGNGTGAGVDAIGGANGHGVQAQAQGTGKSFMALGSSSTVKAILHADTGLARAQIGTTTNHNLRFIANGGELWEIVTGGALQAVGGNRKIANVLDPELAQDALTMRAAAWDNYVMNGHFGFGQRGTSFTAIGTTKTFTLDRWYAYVGAGAAELNVARSTDAPAQFPFSVKVSRTAGGTNTNEMFVVQEIDRDFVARMRGKLCFVGGYFKNGANFSQGGAPVCRVVYGTGAVTETYKTGYTGSTNLISAGVGVGATTWGAFTTNSPGFTVPTTATTMAITFSWVPTGTAGADDSFYITGVMLSQGSISTDYRFCGGTIAKDLHECERYYEKSYDLGTNPATVTDNGAMSGFSMAGSVTNGTLWNMMVPKFRVRKQKVPTITIWALDGTAGSWFFNTLNKASTPTKISETGFYLQNNSGGSYDPGAVVVYGHFAADAEI